MNDKIENKNNELMDPKNDFCFKELFGHNPRNFINLANTILGLKDEKKIDSVTFLNLEMSKENEGDRGSRLDVLAQLNDGSYINIEMQCANYKDFEKRSLMYFSKIYGGQLKKTEKFHSLKPVVIINLVDFIIFDDEEDFHSPLIIANAKSKKRRCKDFEMHFIEIPKFHKTCYDPMDALEKWVLFFKEPEKKTLKELAMHSQEIAQAFENLEILSKDPKSRALYEARKKALMDIDNGMYVNRLEGKLEGRLEGRLEGLEEGEKRKSLEFAKKMKAKNSSLAEIIEFTGLTKEEIDKL